MNRKHLIESAGRLEPVPRDCAEEFSLKQDLIAVELNQRMGARKDLVKLIGEGNLDMMEDNSRNFCRFMSSLFFAANGEVFVETVLWVFRAYRSHGFQTSYWPANIDTCVEILKQELSPQTYQAVYPWYHWLIVNIPQFVYLTESEISQKFRTYPNERNEE